MQALPLLLLTLLAGQGPLFSSSGPSVDDFVLTDKLAYLVFPPTAVGSPQTTFLSWSLSGRYLLLGRPSVQMNPALLSDMLRGNRPPEPATVFSEWDRTKGRTAELGAVAQYEPFLGGRPDEGLRWLAGSEIAFDIRAAKNPGRPGEEPTERAELIRIDAANGLLQVFPIADPIPRNEFFELYISEQAPQALIAETEFWKTIGSDGKSQSGMHCVLWSIDGKGRYGRKSTTIEGLLRQVRWSSDPTKASIMIVPKAPNKPQWYAFDLATGKTQPIATPIVQAESKRPAQALQVETTASETVAGTIKRSHAAIWLKSSTPSDHPVYLLSPRGHYASLNSTLDCVALLDQGVVTVRVLAALPIELYLKAKEAADKARAISNAKQMATCAMMYAADYNDKLPTPEEYAAGALSPYAKNASISEGFQYIFAGGSIQGIENVSTTPLGFVAVAGGFAVAFCDGHVKWMKELPK